MSSDALGRKYFLFVCLGSKIGTPEKIFRELLSKLMETFEVIISSCMNPKKGNTHGVRKGSSTCAAAGTTCPPSLITAALCGEWSTVKTMVRVSNLGRLEMLA